MSGAEIAGIVIGGGTLVFVIINYWQLAAKPALRSMFGISFKEIDMTTPVSEKDPVFQKKMQKFEMDLLNAPLRNPIGRDVIASLKASGGKLLSDANPEDIIHFVRSFPA